MNAALFEPLTVRGLEIRNRIWLPSLCQYSCFAGDGVPVPWHLVHLGQMAAGGAGLVLTEATAVLPEGRISGHDTGIWNDEQQQEWAPVVDFAHSQGAAIGIQLAHAGRKASVWPEWGVDGKTGTQPIAEGGWQTVGPSAIAFGHYDPPRALAADELPGIVAAFVAAAKRAVAAGFDLVEVHAAHGYLLHEFLSPLSNQRTDDWGGPLENRARLLREVVRAIRGQVEVPIFVRLSATDWADGGWDVAQTTQLVSWLVDDGADFFDISTAGLVLEQQITVGPNYQVPFATEVHDGSGADVSAVGLITTAQQAEDIVASGKAQAVMVGRAMMRDPHFALRAAHELGAEIDYWPPQYRRAKVKPGQPF